MSESKVGTNARPPIKEIRVGGITAAIWDRPQQHNGKAVTQYSVRVTKTYRDAKTSDFRTTEYYFAADLPKLVLVAQKAFEFVSLKNVQEDG